MPANFTIRIGLALTLLVSGCAIPTKSISPEGYLEIFGPTSALNKINLPAEWFVDGMKKKSFMANHLRIERIDGSPALNISTGSQNYVFAKRTQASLLAAPFLSWSWNVPSFQGNEYPIRLIIGFHGGDPKSGSWGSQPLVYLGKITPPFDRAISIIWHRNGLLRGTIDHTTKLPKYIARGGIDKTDKWQAENIDLARLYKRLWPKDEFQKVKIMFAGFATRKSILPTSAAFADFVLSK
ncbi:MAG: DUF3047 domain-containing protein [Rhodospirillaceae bacterium]|jgi:hypothetical protein|nr:DUF3047 domain-containing protein [Rhodospirillaceae bacterium]MBT7957546.1 DUF3047 domain-containing protein [Rhodospirillaceae bacterium]